MNSPASQRLTEQQRSRVWNSVAAIPARYCCPTNRTRCDRRDAHACARAGRRTQPIPMTAPAVPRLGTSFPNRTLAQAAQGWFLNDRARSGVGEKPDSYYDEPPIFLSSAPLRFGADGRVPMDKFKGLADQMKNAAESPASPAKRTSPRRRRGWQRFSSPGFANPAHPETKIDVVYGDGMGMFGACEHVRSIQFLGGGPWPRSSAWRYSGPIRSR